MKTIAGMLITVALTLGSGCARSDWIERTLVTVDVTGVWAGTMVTSGGVGAAVQYSHPVRLELEQVGPKVRGSIQASGINSQLPVGWNAGPIDGTVAGDVFELRQTNGILSGELTVSGDEITGRIKGGATTFRTVLQRVSPSFPPGSQQP